MKEGRKEGICGRESEEREERKAFRAEGWPEQRLDVTGSYKQCTDTGGE